MQGTAEQVAEGLQGIVDPEHMIVDVPEVDLGLCGQQSARPVRQDAEGVPLRCEVAPQVQNQPLYGENITENRLIEAGKALLLDAVHELGDLVDDRKIGIYQIDEFMDSLEEKIFASFD